MLLFVLKRLAQSVLVMLVVALIAFALFRYVGDPINNMVGQDTTLDQREALRDQLGLDDPVLRPVRPVHRQRRRRATSACPTACASRWTPCSPSAFPRRFELSLVSAIMALAIGVPMGVYTALNRRGSSAGAS